MPTCRTRLAVAVATGLVVLGGGRCRRAAACRAR